MRLTLRWLIVLTLALPVIVLWPAPAQARPLATIVNASISPNIYTDEFDNSPATGHGCSLREALELAEGDVSIDRGCGTLSAPANVDNMHLMAGTYQLTLPDPLPAVASGNTLNVLDSGATIDGGSTTANRHDGIFVVVGGTLNLSKITLRHGSRAVGGAIYVDNGTLTADTVKFVENDAAYDPALADDGGALYGSGTTITVTHSVFENNRAYEDGGALESSAGYFANDTFIGNQAASGGAVFDPSPNTNGLIFYESTFKKNVARPQLDVQKPKLGYSNKTDDHGGGAIFNQGDLQLTRVVLDGNSTALNRGGGGLLNQGTAELLESAVFNNQASATGGESNSYIDYAWGGGIFNSGAGILQIVRSSIYNNQADYAGAIFNYRADLQLFNSTVSNNTGTYDLGGLVNDHPLFDNSGGGGTIKLLHSTIGKNNPGGPQDNLLYAFSDRSVQFGNSILQGACNQIQYTVGNSVMTGPCDTEVDPSVSPQLPNGDISNTSWLDLQLLPPSPSSQGWSNAGQVMVQKITGASNAVDIGRNDNNGCNNLFVQRKDQNRAARGALCDAGAIEGGQNPPVFSSTPGAGLITFPDVNVNALPATVTTTLVLQNTGGGALSYQVQMDTGDPAITLLTSPDNGLIGKNGSASLVFQCSPYGLGDHWRKVNVLTNAPNTPGAAYKFRCTVAGQTQQASTSDPPGPLGLAGPTSSQLQAPSQGSQLSLPAIQPGQTAHLLLNVRNPSLGAASLSASAAWANPGPIWGVGAPSASIPPGQSHNFDLTCTPPDFGLYLNTLVVTTNDPINHQLQYNVACEATVDSPPEALNPELASSAGAPVQGVAVSPDGTQVLDGQTNTTLDVFDRDPATGVLTASGFAAEPGMSAIQSIAYSRDSQKVYYTSADGNGIVALDHGTDNSLNLSQVITAGSPLNTCFISHFPVPCAIGTLHGADGLAVSPDDQFVYVVGFYDNSLTAFQRQPNGQLALWQIITGTVNGLGGPVKVAVSPDGNDIYAASYLSSTVAVFQRNVSGALSFQAVYTNGVGGLTNMSLPGDLAISPDGNFVYVTASGSGAVNVFQRSQADGGLTLASVKTGVTGAWGVTISNDDAGRRVFVAETTGNNVYVYARDPVSGTLTSWSGNNVNSPVFLAVSLDNQDVYVSLSSPGLQHYRSVHNAPVLSHLSPASALAGSGDFTVTAVGGRFYPDSQIVFAGNVLATQFVDEHTLQALVPAALTSGQGSPNVLVRNTAPVNGAGDSASLPFASLGPAQPAVPSISGIDPAQVSAGEGDVDVYVQGANFTPDAEVYYNGLSVPTLFINDHTLQITLWAALLEAPGTGGLQVVNGGGAPSLAADSAASGPDTVAASKTSTAIGFTVTPPGQPAQPSLSRLEPASVLSGSVSTWITVVGHNFSASTPSVGRWNGLARTSVVVDEHTLLMSLSAADLAKPGNNAITVLTPGIGESKPLNLRVRPPGEKPVPVALSFAINGWTLYVNGSDFVSGAQVRLNGAVRATTFISSDQLKVTLTPADHGLAITVTNPGPGGGLSNLLVAFVSRLFLPLARR